VRETDQDDLIELCRKGDNEAFDEVYHRFARTMLNSCMRILNNLADAEDMVQESFIEAFSKLDYFVYKDNFEGWLARIAINKSLGLLRKRKFRWIDIDLAHIKSSDEAEVSDEANDTNELSFESVNAAIEQLPDNYRIVFNLFAVDEVPQQEIAEMLNISHSNARIIYHRAKRKIKEILRNEYK
jgi:RNA polymerase sigma factor (sigma-70 family)